MIHTLLFTRSEDERGASAVEYGLLIAGIAAVIVMAVYAFGGVVDEALFSTTCAQVTSELEGAAAAACTD